MAKGFVDNSEMVKRAMDDASEAALVKVGMLAEKYAKKNLNGDNGAPKRIDTGRLRNSVTWAISGKAPAITSYQGTKKSKTGKAPESGSYSGSAPSDIAKAVYVGTNVEYALPVHEGVPKKGMAPNRFLKDACEQHLDEYKKIMHDAMK